MTRNTHHEWSIEAFRSLAESGKAVLNTLVLVSGGSGAALLSFVGNLAGKDGYTELVRSLMHALPFFYSAFVLSVVIAGATYVAQAHYKKATFAGSGNAAMWDAEEKKGDRWTRFAVACFLLAIALLAFGGGIAIRSGLVALP